MPSATKSHRPAKCSLVIKLPDSSRPNLRAEISLPQTAKRAAKKSPLKTPAAIRLAGILAAMGHPIRLRILTFLLRGSASYDDLTHATGMRSGPLYFHLHELRTAGLIGPRRRDAYTLTPRGSALALTVLVLGKLRC